MAELKDHVLALTVHQPYASLIILGFKTHEFRTWKPNLSAIGRRLLIHASQTAIGIQEVDGLLEEFDKRYDGRVVAMRPQARQYLEAYRASLQVSGEPYAPLGQALGFVTLGKPLNGPELALDLGTGQVKPHPGVWGWPMLDPKPLSRPITVRGNQGVWLCRVPDVLRELSQAMAA